MRRSSRWLRAAPAALGLALGLLALWPALGPGFTLRYDMVFVPDPPLHFDLGGFPRAVPSDQIVALLSSVVPAQVVQKLILLGVFVLAASGAAALVPQDRTAARLAAAAFYAWNAYLAQRLLLGQWALLLGFAGLPWAVRAAPRTGRRGVGRFCAALLPAAVGGFQAMLVTALTVLPVAALSPGRDARQRLASVLWCAAPMALLSLPWLIPALAAGVVTDPAGVDAFAPRADGPFATLGSLLSLGGVWNAEAALPAQETWIPSAARLLVAAASVFGFVRLAREDRPDYAPGLAVAAGSGLVIACLGAFVPEVLKTLIGWWPGFGPWRDGQVYVAPLALLQALGFAYLVSRLDRAAAFAAVAVPVLVLPTLAFGAFGRLGTAEYPGEWRQVQAIVNGDRTPGALVSLPWGAQRAFAWNRGRVVLDPATKLFARRVIWNDSLRVTARRKLIQLAAEDPRARRVGALLLGGRGSVARALRANGVRYVLIQRSNENAFLSRFPGVTPVFSGRELLLLRL